MPLMYNNIFKANFTINLQVKIRKLSIFCLQDFHPFLAPDVSQNLYHFLAQFHPSLHHHLHLDLSK